MTFFLASALVLAQTQPVTVRTPIPVQPPAVTIPASDEIEIDAPLTMDEAIKIALVKSPVLEAARYAAAAARGRAGAANADLGPQVTLGAGYSQAERFGNSTGNQGDPLSANINLQQLLFDFNRTRNEVRQAGALAEAAELTFAAEINRIKRDVGLNFIAVANAEQLVTIRQGDVNVRQFQLNLAESRLADGLGAPGDVVRARTSLASAMANLVEAQTTLNGNTIQLALSLGVDPATPIKVAPESAAEFVAVAPSELQPMVAKALEQRPEILSARERVKATEFAENAAKQGQSPSIFANVSVSGSGQTSVTERGTTLYGIQMSWPLFDSGRTKSRVAEASALKQQSLADLGQLQLTVSQQVIQAWLDHQTANDRVRLNEVAVANAQEAARIAQGRYADGLGTFLEVTDAQSALLQAQLALINARTDLERARTNLAWALGN